MKALFSKAMRFAAKGRIRLSPGTIRAVKELQAAVFQPLRSVQADLTQSSYARLRTAPSIHPARARQQALRDSRRGFSVFAQAARQGRPSATLPRAVHSVGLQSARSFSSSQHAFKNIIDNVPLAIRAGLDELSDFDYDNKSKSGARVVRRNLPIRSKVNAASLIARRTFDKATSVSSEESVTESEVASLDKYFPSSPSSVASSQAEGVRFLIPLQADFDLSSFGGINRRSANKRLLTRSVLTDLKQITEAQAAHSVRVRNLVDRLDVAGALDHQKARLLEDPDTGKQSLLIEFSPTLSTEDVRQAAAIWDRDEEASWFSIVEPSSPRDSNLPSPGSSIYAEDTGQVESLDQTLVFPSYIHPNYGAEVDVSDFLLELESLPKTSF